MTYCTGYTLDKDIYNTPNKLKEVYDDGKPHIYMACKKKDDKLVHVYDYH